jgi:hypothetical protein
MLMNTSDNGNRSRVRAAAYSRLHRRSVRLAEDMMVEHRGP